MTAEFNIECVEASIENCKWQVSAWNHVYPWSHFAGIPKWNDSTILWQPNSPPMEFQNEFQDSRPKWWIPNDLLELPMYPIWGISYHWKFSDRVIVNCTKKGCPFYMVAEIATRKHFVSKKWTWSTLVVHVKIAQEIKINFVPIACEQTIRTYPNTYVEKLI
jgi:hypothetical protein